MDAAEAEKALREEWGPELQRLRAESGQLAEAREAAATATREASHLRRRCEGLEAQLEAASEAAERTALAADERARGLRACLARRSELLQRLLRDGAEATPEGEELWAAVEEVRAVLCEEAQRRQCCVCADAAADTVLLPCRHQQLCSTCAASLARCPICRAQVRDRMQVYI
mmetsp:Transcript_49737/g.159086  ORF Transcript_49737/g.159086 Transcript_49737/m.159086 type:complete len:172 (+) Transcript_49737:550-1065(+)